MHYFLIHLQFLAKDGFANETTTLQKLGWLWTTRFFLTSFFHRSQCQREQGKSNDYAMNIKKGCTGETIDEPFQTAAPTKGRDLRQLKEQWNRLKLSTKNNCHQYKAALSALDQLDFFIGMCILSMTSMMPGKPYTGRNIGVPLSVSTR